MAAQELVAPEQRGAPTASCWRPTASVLGWDAALIEKREDIGEKIWVPEIDAEFTVTGILEPTGTQDDGFFYLPLATAQERFGLEDQITAVQVRLTDPALAPAVGDELERIFPGAEIIRMEELLGSMTALMDSARALIFAIVAVVIAISAVGVLNTMLMSVFERTREIGVLARHARGRATSSPGLDRTVALTAIGAWRDVVLAALAARASRWSSKPSYTMPPRRPWTHFDPRRDICVLAVLGIGWWQGLPGAARRLGAHHRGPAL